MTERRYRLGPAVIALRAQGRAVDAFAASLAPFETAGAADGVVEIGARVDSVGARTVPLPRVEGNVLIGAQLRATLRASTLNVTQVEGTGELANAFRWLLAELLLGKSAVLVHGAGVLANGRAALWTGKSGAGKSTLASHAKAGGLLVLGDELVIVQATKARPHAFGTPWNTGEAADGPLLIMGTLGWANEPGLQPASPSDILKVASENVLLPREDPMTRTKVAGVLLSVVGSVRTARLDFAPDPTVAELLRTELL